MLVFDVEKTKTARMKIDSMNFIFFVDCSAFHFLSLRYGALFITFGFGFSITSVYRFRKSKKIGVVTAVVLWGNT